MPGKPTYHINSFFFQKQLFERYLSDRFDFSFSPPAYERPLPAWLYVPFNFLYLIYLALSGRLAKQDVVQYNRAESYLFARRWKPGQVSVCEVHGFDVGVVGQRYLQDIRSTWKRAVGGWLDRLLEPFIQERLRACDLLYVSTPDLIEPISTWLGRTPAWLPNPIDTEQFSPAGERVTLRGSPAVLFASRLHGDKKPEIGFRLFRDVILPKYPEAILYLISSGELVEQYRAETAGDSRFVWLPYMDKPTLAATIRGAALAFGDFSIGALSMLPLQVMLCKTPIVTLDRYEVVKREVEELPELTLQLLSDQPFRTEYVERCYRHALDCHSPEAVCRSHLENLGPLLAGAAKTGYH